MNYITSMTKRPQNKSEIEKVAKSLGLSMELLEKVKEEVKQTFSRKYGRFPKHSEGCCLLSAQRLLDFINGHLRGGWFITDSQIEARDVRYVVNGLPRYLCDIDSTDHRKLSHWWVEFKNYIIDLTAEQFNPFLNDKMEKVEIIPKNSPKAQRYEEMGWEESDNEDEFEEENEDERANNSISF
jgi:hypothetical protein